MSIPIGDREYHAERIAEEARRILDDRQMSRLSYTPTYREPDEFPEYIWAILDGEAVAYFPERTCHNKARHGNFKCDACNAFLQLTDFDEEPMLTVDGVGYVPDYCPHCGAKVVEK